ncbi:ferric reductase NAD binding domain-containing protein [Astrocystis sublimbata]|nr:ferric reductase NAD binding domain-containing protein [Astrocystis sublimbata]
MPSNQSWMAARLKVNGDVMTYYAISLVALMVLFIVGHWARYVTRNTSQSVLYRPITAASRVFRRVSLRKAPGFTSVGHSWLVVVYVALNALFSFYRVDCSKLGNLAARFGWMATGNMVFVVFLALKNTPLALLSAYSYERLNSLHQIVGYTTLLQTALHGVLYTYSFMTSGKTYLLQEDVVTAGIVLGFATLFTVLAGMTLRRLNYELFYIIHLALFVVIVVTLGLHRPTFEDKALIATVLMAAIWFFDRLIRVARLAYNSINNEATIFPLPNGGTRIVMKKSIARARPGKHCYVWMPQIRAFETHPFTIVATEPLELVVNTYSGFTRDLHRHASNNPGASLKVSAEGPYGTNPDPMDYDKVVLVAGGAGATFAIGLAVDMLRRMTLDSNKRIELIWSARGRDNMTWFTRHLNDMITHECAPKIALKLHLTRVETSSTPSIPTLPRLSSQASTAATSAPGSILEKTLESPVLSAQTSSVALDKTALDVEKGKEGERVEYIEDASLATKGFTLPVLYGRPNIEASVREAIASVAKDKRVFVAVCGPTGLVDTVRNTTASCISVDGPSVELHCEQFGW